MAINLYQDGEMRALASVLIPSYNSPDLKLTIQSVLEQDYSNIEIILIDDCSSEFSPKDIEDYINQNKSSNIVDFIISQNDCNLGTVKTMNRAFKYARGEYIFSLAGDDCFYDRQVITDWINEFEKSKAEVITAKRADYDSEMSEEKGTAPTVLQIHMIKTLSPEALFEKIAVENFVLGCCTARKKTVLKEFGYFDESYRMIDDHPFVLKYLREGNHIHFFDRCVIKYRGGGVSSAENCNLKYMEESDMIFANEVTPFAKNPKKILKQYMAWKRHRRLLNNYLIERSRYENNCIMPIILQIMVRIKMPLYTMKRIVEKFVIERILK